MTPGGAIGEVPEDAPAPRGALQQPTGVHHIAMMARDIKQHISFFSQVLGCPLVALFEMHGVPGGLHAFLKLDEGCYFSIVQLPGTEDIPIELGRTHAGRGDVASAPGTMQHLAFAVPTPEDLLALRDRIRSHGVPVLGPIDHGFCRSIYFAGPDHMALEAAVSTQSIDPSAWIDPAVLQRADISPDEAQRFKAPPPFDGPRPVPQPAFDETKPHMTYPRDAYLQMLATPDEIIARAASYPNPPVTPQAAAAG